MNTIEPGEQSRWANNPASHRQDNRRYSETPEQNRIGVELIYWRICNHLAGWLEAQKPYLLVDITHDLQSVVYNIGDGASQMLAKLNQDLTAEHQKRQSRHDKITGSLSQRLVELNLSHDRPIEEGVIASAWYRQHTTNFNDQAGFYQTRLELTRLQLLACHDFNTPSWHDGLMEAITQMTEDECLAALNRVYAQEMSACCECWQQIAGREPEDEDARNAIAQLQHWRSPQPRSDPNQTTDHSQLRYTLEQIGELRRAWDQTFDLNLFVSDWFTPIRDLASDQILAADEASQRIKSEIHRVGSAGS